ncbi:MAG: hypothetical protein K8963_06025, partial [Proteobacteria bacterium]|nr:hypothetical protein [Pseudomonadota bacterium]
MLCCGFALSSCTPKLSLDPPINERLDHHGFYASSISANSGHTCAVTVAGELYCWGSGDNGRLGHDDGGKRVVPVRVGFDSNWKEATAGGSHTCAVKTTGELYCWGFGGNGRLGLGDN